MIHDLQRNWSTYFRSPAGLEIGRFIASLTPALEEGEYAIGETGAIGRVSLNQTRASQGAKPEAHNQFVDIQIVLDGEEIVLSQPRALCRTSDPYVRDRDVEFFYPDNSLPGVEMRLAPGAFAVFFPQDAHTPLLRVGAESTPVKKIVIKVPVTLALSC